jgi:hypothetical protein
MNQCDGCNAGMPMKGGFLGSSLHVNERGHVHMVCTEAKYKPKEPTGEEKNEADNRGK